MPRKSTRKKGINLTPLIDVVFLILAFLMVNAQITHQAALKVDLPSIEGQGKPSPTTQQITIDKTGAVYFDDTAMKLENIAERVVDLSSTTLLEIRPDRAAPSGVLVNVLDILQENHITNIRIAAVRKQCRE